MTTLARLSFEIKADQLDGFASVYERQIAPILKQHNLVPTTAQDRPLAAADSRPQGDVSDFSQLFAVASLDAVWAHGQALAADPAWQHALAQLNPLLWNNGTPYRWGFYQTPAGAGKTRKAGPGKTLEAGPGNTLRIGF